MENKDCYTVKICVLGDSSVGKSSIAVRFVQDTFDPGISSTIGAAFLTRFISTVNGNSYKLHIWDTAGQERYKSLTPMYYRSASVVLLVYDITHRQTLIKGIRDWVCELRDNGPSDPILALVGNKIDMGEDLREVEEADAREYAEKIGATFYEASAKTGQNVSDIFLDICSKLERRVSMDLASTNGQHRNSNKYSRTFANGNARLQLGIDENNRTHKCCNS